MLKFSGPKLNQVSANGQHPTWINRN